MLRLFVTSAVLVAALATGARAASPTPSPAPSPKPLPLQMGQVTGTVQAYTVRPGEDLETIAFTHGVAVTNVVQPSKGLVKNGLKRGMKLFVDQRQIVPVFPPTLSGIVLNLPEAEVYLLDNGNIVKRYPVGVSLGDQDWRAPVGDFKVVDKEKNPTWHIPKSIQKERAKKGLAPKTEVAPGVKNPLGSRWIGFADGTVGFHGTPDSTSIKRATSHGCVHFLKADIEDLYDRVEVGTPVHVVYQPVVMANNLGAMWLSAFPDFYERHVDYRATVKQLAGPAYGTLDLHKVEQWLRAKDGLVHNVSRIAPNPATGAASPAP